MKFTILVDPSLVIITIHLVYMDHAPEKNIFEEIHQFYYFYPKITSAWVGGNITHNFGYLSTKYATHKIL